MALDNANFISELSIVDPPGSDPLSQGDDQIRTIKRATQQSFPLIAAAVNIDDVQMNLMAIKNEANLFTLSGNSFAATTIFQGSGAASPTLSFQQLTVVKWHIRGQLVGDALDFRRFVAGVFQDVPMSLDNATGVVDFLLPPTVAGAPLWIAGEIRMFAATATPGTNWFLANGTNGTVDLQNRALIGTGLSTAGTALNPNLVGTAASGTTGGTAITVSTMPAHAHRIWSGRTGSGITDSVLGNTAEVTVVGANRGNAQRQYDLDTGFGAQQIIEDTGSGNTHTHSVPSRSVTENGTDRNTVRPLSRVVEMHQYVP